MTGFEGNSTIKTPNLDRLAADGVWFSRCYTPTPQSAPAHATVLTGQYPHTHGVRADGLALNRDADTFTARLEKIGYACGFVGDWDLPSQRANDPGFGLNDYLATDDGKWTGAKVCVNGNKDTVKGYLTDWQADRAIEFLDRFHERPFCLWVSFDAPHEPLEYPPDAAQQYPPDALKLPKTMEVDKKTWPTKLQNSPPSARFAPRKANQKSLRQDLSKYYATIARTDQDIGRILARVDKLGLRGKTVVIFACCNGYALGNHALDGKGPAFFEELVRRAPADPLARHGRRRREDQPHRRPGGPGPHDPATGRPAHPRDHAGRFARAAAERPPAPPAIPMKSSSNTNACSASRIRRGRTTTARCAAW